jgi:hypothetical protein
MMTARTSRFVLLVFSFCTPVLLLRADPGFYPPGPSVACPLVTCYPSYDLGSPYCCNTTVSCNFLSPEADNGYNSARGVWAPDDCADPLACGCYSGSQPSDAFDRGGEIALIVLACILVPGFALLLCWLMTPRVRMYVAARRQRQRGYVEEPQVEVVQPPAATTAEGVPQPPV